jgi:hypothetical protein
MMYVLARDYRVFRSFCHEFGLKPDALGNGNGVSPLPPNDPLLDGLGHDNIILMAYGGEGLSRDCLAKVRARCEYQQIPLLFIPA